MKIKVYQIVLTLAILLLCYFNYLIYDILNNVNIQGIKNNYEYLYDNHNNLCFFLFIEIIVIPVFFVFIIIVNWNTEIKLTLPKILKQ